MELRKRNISSLLPPQVKTILTWVRYQRIYRTSPQEWIRRQWRLRYGTDLNLEKPQTYNERLQWLKVYGEQRPDVFGDVDLARRCADKVAVRDYVEAVLGPGHTVPVLGIYARVRDIPFNHLPEQFVLKASHDSGSTVIVTDKGDLEGRLRERLKKLELSLGVNYGLLKKEWVYNKVVPRVIVEELLSADHRTELWDYKVFVFRGEPKLIQVDVDRFGDHRRSFYTPDWKKTDLAVLYKTYPAEISRPPCLETMLEYSSRLAQPFLHARVDWYWHKERLLLGEITFFHGSGFEPFNDRSWEIRMGDWMAWDSDG